MKKKLLKLATLTLILVMLGMALTVTASAAWEETAQGWQFSENGRPATGWREIDGARFFFNSAGVMQTGWVEYNGQWFYLLPSGAMATGSWRVDGVWHNFGTTGTWSGESLPRIVANQPPVARPPVARPPAEQPSAPGIPELSPGPSLPSEEPSEFEGLWELWRDGGPLGAGIFFSFRILDLVSDGTGTLYYYNYAVYNDFVPFGSLTWNDSVYEGVHTFEVDCDVIGFRGEITDRSSGVITIIPESDSLGSWLLGVTHIELRLM